MLGDANASKSSTKGVDERKREGSVNRRSSQYVKKSTRWYWRGEDETTQNKLRVEVSKAKAQLVRHGHKRQVRLEQQRIVEEIKGQGNLRSFDDEALLVGWLSETVHQAMTKSSLCFRTRLTKLRVLPADKSVEKTSKGRFEHGAASTVVQRF